ncbi:lipoprotein [Cedecea neteri]|uniref:Lipoprotein n=1 Tax=Cedecea neteri TaxID=158822 RepID=A0A2X3IJC5_9ENTR|nr:lipoprotein [Cedecea neteri]
MMTLNNKKVAAAMLAITLAMSLSACSNWSKRDRNTAIGAGAGALGGAVLDRRQHAGYAWRCGSRRYYRSPGGQIRQDARQKLTRFDEFITY